MDKYVLLKMQSNWADEFDFDAFWVTTEDNWKKFQLDLMSIKDEINFKEVEIYFGTNEWVSFYSAEEIINSIKVFEISKLEKEFLHKIFGTNYRFSNEITYGLIDISNLPNHYLEYHEYKKQQNS